jgi:hypothetical protein
MMRELACQFGEASRLQGVLTMPRNARPGPVLVLISAGLTAKSGPYRLYASLARTLARHGFMTLRFDLGGIGSSQIARPDQGLEERTMADIRDALEYLERTHGAREFVLGGLCSGAEDSFRYAETDARVTGVVLVDPHAYESPYWHVRGRFTRYLLNRIVFKLLRVTKLINVVDDEKTKSNVEGFEGQLINYQYMRSEEAARILSTLLGRGARVHYIYTAGRIDVFHHRRQFRSMFPGIACDAVVLDHLPFIEHVQIFGEDRDLLVDTITRRFLEGWGEPARAAA